MQPPPQYDIKTPQPVYPHEYSQPYQVPYNPNGGIQLQQPQPSYPHYYPQGPPQPLASAPYPPMMSSSNPPRNDVGKGVLAGYC